MLPFTLNNLGTDMLTLFSWFESWKTVETTKASYGVWQQFEALCGLKNDLDEPESIQSFQKIQEF